MDQDNRSRVPANALDDLVRNQYGKEDEHRHYLINLMRLMDTEGEITKEVLLQKTLYQNTGNSGKYWLAHSMRAFAEWAVDRREIAEAMLSKALSENRELTALLFTLICLRMGRKDAALAWCSYYLELETQSAETVQPSLAIVIEALAAGVLDLPMQELCKKQLSQWRTQMQEGPRYNEIVERWQELFRHMNSQGLASQGLDSYPVMRDFSRKENWPQLEQALRNARLYTNVKQYFTELLERRDEPLSQQKRQIYLMYNLVFDYDHEGAAGNIDLFQLLTGIIMSHREAKGQGAAQKYALAFSKEWILDAFRNTAATNRSQLPPIEICVHQSLDIHPPFRPADVYVCEEISFKQELTFLRDTDADEEGQTLTAFNRCVGEEKQKMEKQYGFNNTDTLECVVGVLFGLIAMGIHQYDWGYEYMGHMTMFAIMVALAILAFKNIRGAISTWQEKKHCLQTIMQQLNKFQNDGRKVLQDYFAELSRFRKNYDEDNANAAAVESTLESLTEDQYIEHSQSRVRHIML